MPLVDKSLPAIGYARIRDFTKPIYGMRPILRGRETGKVEVTYYKNRRYRKIKIPVKDVQALGELDRALYTIFKGIR